MRKVKEEIESLRKMHCGKKVLNSFESLTIWRLILERYFKDEFKMNSRRMNIKFVYTCQIITSCSLKTDSKTVRNVAEINVKKFLKNPILKQN